MKLHGLGQGRYLIQAIERGKSVATTTIDTIALGDKPVELRLAAVLPVHILPTSPVERTDVHCVTIYDQRRTPIWARFVRGYKAEALLPAGRYSWDLHSGTQLLRSGQFELAAERDAPQIGAR